MAKTDAKLEKAREIAVREVEAEPGILQAEVANRVHWHSGLGHSASVRLLRRLEAEGILEPRMQGRKKGYVLNGVEEEPDLEEREEREEEVPPEEPHPAEPDHPEPEPEEEVAPERDPDPFPPPVPPAVAEDGQHSRLPLIGAGVAVVAVIAVAVALLAGGGDDAPEPSLGDADTTGARQQATASPAPAEELPPPSPLKQAQTMETAVLSATGVPGIAARTGRRLERDGFWVGKVDNAPNPSNGSAVLFGAGAREAAEVLARRLDITEVREAGDAVDRVAPGARLYVIIGGDRTS